MKTELEKSEHQAGIEKSLSELQQTAFADDNYPLDLVNLIRSIKFIKEGIEESMEFMESTKTDNSKERFLNQIHEKCFCIATLCDTLEMKINFDDYNVVNNLVFDYINLKSEN